MTQTRPILVVMAAGMGSRYGGLKQIDPVGSHGEAILDYSLYDARRAGFRTVVFIIKHEIEKDFKATVGRRAEKSGMEIRYAYQQVDNLPQGYTLPAGRTKPWGTAHAILCAADAIDAPFAVINADDYYGLEAYQKIFDYLSTHQDKDAYAYAMVGFQLQNTVSDNGSVSRGVCVTDSQGCLRSVTERTRIEKRSEGIFYTEDGGETWQELAGETTVSMNLFGFGKSFVQEVRAGFPAFLDRAIAENPLKGEYFLPSVVSRLINEGKARVQVLTSRDKWYGVTYQQDKPVVTAALAQKTAEGLYPEELWAQR